MRKFFSNNTPNPEVEKDSPSLKTTSLLPSQWFMLYQVQKRIIDNKVEKSQISKSPISIVYGFIAALFYGGLMSICFTYDYASIPGYMILGIWVIAFFYPIYRTACIPGFVPGRTVTFGASIPTIASWYSLDYWAGNSLVYQARNTLSRENGLS